MDGPLLSSLMRKHGITGPYLAKAARLTEGSIYRYYGLETIKKATIHRLLSAVGLSMKDWDEHRQGGTGTGTLMLQDDAGENAYRSIKVLHQGNNLADLMKQKGIKAAALANRMNISRRTLYNWIKEKELDHTALMDAAQALGVPVAAIKGYGIGEKSMEKDIYTILRTINERLSRIERHLQITE